jgi:hypothetical protein
MMRKPSTWLVIALTGGAFIAGCGGASNSTTAGRTGTSTSPAHSSRDTHNPLSQAITQELHKLEMLGRKSKSPRLKEYLHELEQHLRSHQ